MRRPPPGTEETVANTADEPVSEDVQRFNENAVQVPRHLRQSQSLRSYPRHGRRRTSGTDWTRKARHPQTLPILWKTGGGEDPCG